MPKITLYPNENFERALKRFKKVVERSDILKDYQKHEFYEPPSVRRKREKAAAIKREEKRILNEAAEIEELRRNR